MKSKIIKVSLVLIGIILVIFGISKMVKYEVVAIQANASNAKGKDVTDAVLMPGEIDPNTWNPGFPSSFNAADCEANSMKILEGFYCLTPGTALNRKYDITMEKAFELEGKTYTAYHTHASAPSEGAQTNTIYNIAGIYDLTPAAAYVLSSGDGSWSEDKQRALWNLDKVSSQSEYGGASSYDKSALDYGTYDSLVRGNGLSPTNKTDLDSVYTKVNQTTGEYIVGPFNIEYISGSSGNTSFSGISSMYVIGYNSKGQQVRSDIKVEGIIRSDSATGLYGNEETPQYFNPDGSTKVSEGAQIYPQSGQDFQIVFKDPNAGLSEDDENRVASISLKIKFQYMIATAKYAKYTGTRYRVAYTHEDDLHDHKYTSYRQCMGQGEDHPDLNNDGLCDDPTHRVEVTRYVYNCPRTCTKTCYLEPVKQQDLMMGESIRSVYEQEMSIEVHIKITMDLGGHVWEDGVASKESKADGISNTTGDNIDKPLKNVKVTLYTQDGKIATLLSDATEEGISNETLMHRVNPTYTDENGNYLFEGLDPMKKYYVRFEYNGQTYIPTEYLNTANTQYSSVSQMVNAGLYNTNEWKYTSKGTEEPSKRDTYNNQFGEVGSYPENYVSSNSLNVVGTKNAAFTQKDLMGYTLDRDGKYKQTEQQLIDGYLYDENGLETTTYSQGIISDKIREYIYNNKKSPDANAMKNIYSQIAGNNTELWQKLQFIEDCKIESYTQAQGSPRDLYPVYNQFRINHAIGNAKYETAEQAQNGNYDSYYEVLNGIVYNPIYPGQFFVNQGLWRRPEFDAAARKDVYRAVLKINDKTVMYKYDDRGDDDKYWDINVRMSDYDTYYSSGYNRELYKTDYEYSSQALNHPGTDLEIYVTYKITIRNQSQSIMNQIKEVVDYYDKDYTYRNDLSWVTYVDNDKNNSVTDDEYYEAMVAEDVSKIKNARDTKASTSSKYGDATKSDVTDEYNAIYIRGLEDKKLASGESAYIYLTFQVKKENGKVILDDESSPKQNLAEINGYVTYYKDNTKLPNGVIKNSDDIAGLLDRDSNPGNLNKNDIEDNDRYEKNFEDDTDRAKSLRIVVDEDAIRKVNGTVWEDERTVQSGDSIIGDGIRQDKEITVSGVTVQLVEKTVDGKEYIWQEATTDANGAYSFENYIPGDYVIRFYYGNTVDTVKVEGNSDYTAGGKNDVSYNGQDFKSTTYQAGITQEDYTDTSNRYTGYKNTLTQNETGTYGYDIYAADSNKSNVSDAKDIWSVSNNFARTYNPNVTISEKKEIQGRLSVINYSNNDVTNHKSEVLASPYDTPSYNGTKYTKDEMDSLINELIANTYMTAETGVIAVEFEYDRQQTDGGTAENAGVVKNDNNNQINGNYTLANIDLGIVERPKAQLELDKSIANIKVTLVNNSVLFDVNKAGDNVIWKDHEEYNLASKQNNSKYEDYYGDNGKNRYSYREEVDKLVNKTDKGLIQITMDEELMHGATIEITYKVKVTNVGEVDYDGQKFYYLGDSTGAEKSTTQANQVVDYVANNLQFNSNNTANEGWSIINKDNLKGNGLVNSRLSDSLDKFNSIIQTEGLNARLKPGESTEKTLVLTQLITSENTSDDLTYSNITEIIKTSNTVGRRMAYSVVGNQNPTDSKAAEVDSSVAEKVIILPPFGQVYIYYIIAAVVGIILIGGIALIIKKVLKK